MDGVGEAFLVRGWSLLREWDTPSSRLRDFRRSSGNYGGQDGAARFALPGDEWEDTDTVSLQGIGMELNGVAGAAFRAFRVFRSGASAPPYTPCPLWGVLPVRDWPLLR